MTDAAVEKSRRERFRPASGQNPKRTRVQLSVPIADIPVNVFLILAMGAAVGFVSGLFGIGGGFLLSPPLVFPPIPPPGPAAPGPRPTPPPSFSGPLSLSRPPPPRPAPPPRPSTAS